MQNTLAQRIKTIRTERGLSQQQFGELLSVSQDNVSLWENYKSTPSAEHIIKICKIFEISADYLLGLED